MAADVPQDETISTFSEVNGGRGGLAIASEPHLYLVIEADRPRAGSARCALGAVDEVVLRRAVERSIERAVREGREGRRSLAIGVPDRRMSGKHASIARDGGAFAVLDHGSRNGTWRNGERLASGERALLRDGDVIEVGRTFFRFRAAVPTPEGTAADVTAASVAATPPGLRTLIPSLSAAFGAVSRVARSGVPMVVTGATGTGKELFARAVHALSGRSGAFVAVNCGALPEALVESQLFGHARGAFSGAVREEPGYVRAAHRGTLFLDEIADLARPSQAALLRVLQESEVTPVGATRAVPVDFRVLCATHGDLDALAVTGEFRLDLLARLAGLRIRLPGLRDRTDELGTLVAELLAGRGMEHVTALEPEAVRALVRHDWPMNVRELGQCLALAAALAPEGVIGLGHLPEMVRVQSAARSAREVMGACERPALGASARDAGEVMGACERPALGASTGDAREPAGASERPGAAQDAAGEEVGAAPREESAEDAALRAELVAAFSAEGGNVSAVARSLGKARMQVQRWMKRFDIDPAAFKPR